MPTVDPAVLAEVIAAGNAQQAALRSLPHRCTYSVPYAGGMVERKLVTKCGCCVAMNLWDDAMLKIAPLAVKP